MRVVVLGGTRFVGRSLVEELLRAGHTVLLVHRGIHEPEDSHGLHIHTDRASLAVHVNALEEFQPEAVVDLSAMTGEDAERALDALPAGLRLVVASSIDVYRAYSSVWDGALTDPVPLTEESELRTEPPPDAGSVPDGWSFDASRYEKLDVERAYVARGATVCRLPMVYGPHDYKHREEFVLRRVRAERQQIPVGAGNWLWSRGYVGEIARGLRLVLEADASGEVFNLAEASCAPIREWMETILDAAGSDAELVPVPDHVLPSDLVMTGAIAQDWAVDTSKARELLGWVHAPADECVAKSVRWHLDNPPATDSDDFADDERAIAA
jgi:nucleoside-diphosphate-sugar epimerase